MPESFSIHICKYCNKEFEQRGHAVTCEKSHLVRGFRVFGAVRAADLEKMYLPGDRYPAAIEVHHDDSQKKAIYVRIPDGERPVSRQKRPRGGPEIIHRS